MKIIDERGRLFGKINLIDFLVLFFLVSSLPMFYFAYRIYKFKPSVIMIEDTVFITTELNCKFIKVPPEIVELIKEGEKEVNSRGEVIGEITWLGEVSPYIHDIQIGSGEKISRIDPNLKEIPCRIKMNMMINKDGTAFYRDERICTDSSFRFLTEKYELETRPAIAIAIAIKDNKNKGEKLDIEINCKFIKVPPDVLKLIKEGDKELDSNGNIIGEITWLGEVSPYEYKIEVGAGESLIKPDPYLKEILCRLKIKAGLSKNELLYYKNEQIIKGFPFRFITEKYSQEVIPFQEAVEVANKKWIRIRVKLSSMIPEIANIVRKGDVQEDLQENIIARLEEILYDKPSSVLIFDSNNKDWLQISHPFQRDMEVIFDIKCTETKRKLYFDNYLVMIGNTIAFSTDTYRITGTIIDLVLK